MNRTAWKTTVLVLTVSLALWGGVEAQQQPHRENTPASQEQASQETPETPAQMHRMMQQMHRMMQQMHNMMQQTHGKMGRPGMMASEDDEASGPGMMRGDRHMMDRGMMRSHENMMRPGMMIQRKLERLTQQLELTAEQKAQVQPLLRTEAKEAIRLKADIDTTTIDLHQLLDADPIEIARVKTALQTIATKEVDLRLAHITKMQDIRQLLTPEQQQKFRMSWAHMMERGDMMKHGAMRHQEGMRMHGKKMHRGGMQGHRRMTNPCGMPKGNSQN